MIQFHTPLLPHQEAAVGKLLPIKIGAMFMEMGTGKTRAALELAARRAAKISRVLWFCPVSLKETIRQEVAKHGGATAEAGTCVFDEHTGVRAFPQGKWLYIVGLESLSGSRRVQLAVHQLVDENAFLVVDESQFIKNHRAERSQWLYRFAQVAKYRLVLTGTPLTNGVVDLYAQMRFLSPDILGYKSFHSFSANHLEYHPKYKGMIVRAHNTDRLAEKIAPYVYQVKKDECLTLPEKLYEERWVTMTPEQRDLYGSVKEQMLRELDAAEPWDSTVIFRMFGALQQITCGFWHEIRRHPATNAVIGSKMHEVRQNRLEALAATLYEIPNGEKVIIWAKYRRCVEEILRLLCTEFGEHAARFDGELNERERERELSRWRDSAGPRFFVATPSCGGQGLTLNESAHAVFYTNGFKFSERQQAEDRQHRIGQTRPVTYCDIGCSKSIDERIVKALGEKANVADVFIRKVQELRAQYEGDEFVAARRKLFEAL